VRPAVRIAVLAIVKIALQDRTKVRVEQEPAGKAIKQRAESGDGGGEDDAVGIDDPGRLPQGTDPVSTFGKVVQRTQEQDGVEAGRGGAEVARVAEFGGDAAMGGSAMPDLFHVPGDAIEQVDVVAVVGEPGGVDPGAAAHVQDPLGTWWEVSTDNLARAQQLELTEPLGDALRFVDLLVVVFDDLVGESFHGQQRTARTGSPHRRPHWFTTAVSG
jgi:hypothetical protein